MVIELDGDTVKNEEPFAPILLPKPSAALLEVYL
jgi:hypothetical protein